jgi:alcohol dehydrogenase
MGITFKLDPETIIGADALSLAGTICSRYGKRIMIAADHSLDASSVKRLKDILEDSGVEAVVFDGVEEQSSADMADNVTELCRAAHCTAVIGFGGPDTQAIARMTAVMAPMGLSVFQLLEGRNARNKFLPLISIPTAGTDAFMFTDYFIIADPRDRMVKSVSSPDKLHAAVILDSSLSPQLSGANWPVSVFNGFCIALEAYCSTKANFLSDTLLEKALALFAKMMRTSPDKTDVDTVIQAGFLASMGASLSSPGLSAALAQAFNARFKAAKHQCAAVLLPFIMEKLAASRPEKTARVASLLSNTKFPTVAEAANSAAGSVRARMEAFKIKPDLKDFSISLDRMVASAEAARNLEFVSYSPWTVTEEDLFEILKSIV